uniref:Ionotropic glutamate receptor C-terminal domain-containing protein n=2 Tax=Cacopsylla melanoneura TaxID=428564 RepID=A0A8D8ZBE2_9HEMI
MSVLGAICQQGLDKVPNSASGRLTLLVTSITCLFLVTSYAANIVALIQTPSSVIRTVTDLAESPFTVKLHEFQHNRAFLRDVKKDPKLNREAKYLYDKKLHGQPEAKLFVNASVGI